MTKTIKLKLFEGNEAIAKNVKLWGVKGKKQDELAHVLALSIINHIDLHGDTNNANDLVATMIQNTPKSMRVNALIDWFVAHGKLVWNVEMKQLAYAKHKTTKLQEGAGKPFWEFRAEPEYKPFDLDTQLIKLVERATKKAENPHEGDNIPTTLLEKLIQIAPKKQDKAA